MRYAIIGLGFIYPRHKKAIEETGGQVVLTCDIDKDKNPDFTDWEAMYASEKFQEVDAVVICTPNYLHSDMAREALKLGKKVLCEKPLSINGTEGLEGVNTVLQLRYSPEVNRVRALKPYRVDIKCVFRRGDDYFAGWKGDKQKSGGLMYNLGIHYFDLLVYLLGEHTPKRSRVSVESVTYQDAGNPEREVWCHDLCFENGFADIRLRLSKTDEPSRRMIVTYRDGRREEVQLSNKENLSYEDLHIEVYKDFIKGEGISLAEVSKSLNLVKSLTEHNVRN